jgi:hypothetical protein
MKLKREDKELLIEWGYKEEDLNQIEEATTKTTYEMNGKKVSQKKALEILGERQYLSGISRSAFHRSAVRNNINGELVYFDSSKLFK